MLKDVWLFVKERFSLKITLPLTIILFGAPFSLRGGDPFHALSGGLSTFLILLCLRIADDLSDIERDQRYHPERGLSSGRIGPDHLKKFIGIGAGILVLLNIWTSFPLVIMTGVSVYYALYFKKLKHRLPPIIRPFFSNAIFGIIPLYASLLWGDLIEGYGLLGAFIYMAAVAHEWSHNVQGPEEKVLGRANYSQLLGSRGSALVALILFGLSGLFGWLFWLKIGRPVLFGFFFMGTSVQILFLGIRLIRNPISANARPFYIFGFTFFLLPVAGLFAERLF